MEHDRIGYSVGSEHDPGDPFGRSELVIATDGAARLDQVTRAGSRAWTGQVLAPVLEQIWAGLALAGFPAVPPHPLVAGATLRTLAVGTGPARRAARVEWRAAQRLPGYAAVFALLDAIVRQLSQDTVTATPAVGVPVVAGVAPA